MAQVLVLIRHGKAQSRDEESPDSQRRLTEAGARALKSKMPYALSLLAPLAQGAHVALWSSPAVRAWETAEIVLDALGANGIPVDSIESDASLFNQDEQAFLQRLHYDARDVVVAVGHEPFASNLSEVICGSALPFATGGVAAFFIDWEASPASVAIADTDTIDPLVLVAKPVEVGTGRLQWFMQGPMSQDWKTLVHFERVLSDAAENIENRRRAFFEDPDDPETMHKLRVSIRTARGLVDFVRSYMDKRQNASILADLKAVVAETSHLRELDVLTEEAGKLEPIAIDLLGACAGVRAHERDRVMPFLESKGARMCLKRALAGMRSISWKKRINCNGLAAENVRRRFDALVQELDVRLSSVDLRDPEETHDVRKDAKQARYVAEWYSELVGEDAPAIAKRMIAQQDDLGAICDARANIAIIDSFPRSSLTERAEYDLGMLRANNEMYLFAILRNQFSEPTPAQPEN